MQARIPLVPGAKYFAGFSRPFFISDDMVRSHLEALGASNIVFHTREQLPPDVNPKLDPGYSDDWDEWLSADYNGPANTATETKHWAWAIRRVKGKNAKASQGKLTPEPLEPVIEATKTAAPFLIGLELGFLVLFLRRLKRR